MPYGEKAERLGHMGREYWSRRPGSMGDWGKPTKRFTHRAERTQAHRDEKKQLMDANTIKESNDERTHEFVCIFSGCARACH